MLLSCWIPSKADFSAICFCVIVLAFYKIINVSLILGQHKEELSTLRNSLAENSAK